MNRPITRDEVKAAKEAGKRVIAVHTFPNRAKRRENEQVGRILNNRKNTPGRNGGAVLLKMAYFSMAVNEKIRKARW